MLCSSWLCSFYSHSRLLVAVVMAAAEAEADYSVPKIAKGDAITGVRRRRIGSHACSSVSSVVLNASVFLREPTATSNSALATTNGRPKKEALSALNSILLSFLFYVL